MDDDGDDEDDDDDDVTELGLAAVVKMARAYNCPLQTLTLLRYIQDRNKHCKEEIDKMRPVNGRPGMKGAQGSLVINPNFLILL